MLMSIVQVLCVCFSSDGELVATSGRSIRARGSDLALITWLGAKAMVIVVVRVKFGVRVRLICRRQ